MPAAMYLGMSFYPKSMPTTKCSVVMDFLIGTSVSWLSLALVTSSSPLRSTNQSLEDNLPLYQRHTLQFAVRVADTSADPDSVAYFNARGKNA
jgi:hypothetical protein